MISYCSYKVKDNQVICDVSIVDEKPNKQIKYTRYPFANYWFSQPRGKVNRQEPIERIVNGYELFIPKSFPYDCVDYYEFRVKEKSLFSDEIRSSTWSAIPSELAINYYKGLGEDWYVTKMDSEGIQKFYETFEFRYCGVAEHKDASIHVYDRFNDLHKVINPNTLEVEIDFRKINALPSEERFAMKRRFDELY